MYANLPLRSHAFVAIAALGAAATVGLTTAEAAPMSIFMSRPNVGVARAGPAFVPRPARPMLGSPFVARPVGSLLGNRASNRFSPVNSKLRSTPPTEVPAASICNEGQRQSHRLTGVSSPTATMERTAASICNEGQRQSHRLTGAPSSTATTERTAASIRNEAGRRSRRLTGVQSRWLIAFPVGPPLFLG